MRRILAILGYPVLTLIVLALLSFGLPALMFFPAAAFFFITLFNDGPRHQIISRIPRAVAGTVIIPIFMAAIFAPSRVMGAVLIPLLRGVKGVDADALDGPLLSVAALLGTGPFLVFWFDTIVGICGLGMAVYSGRGLAKTFRELRQVFNLPTSKARSAAVGLVELRGVARAGESPKDSQAILTLVIHPQRGDSPQPPTQLLHPFYLEDETGRIRVDPRQARIRLGWNANFWEDASQSWIRLTRRVEKSGGGEVRTLMPGDPVYVIGTAEMDEEAPRQATDAARLVVRPSSRRLPASWFSRLMGEKEAKGRDIHDAFLIADTSEVNVPSIILGGARQVALYTAIYLASCGWLVWTRLPMTSYVNWPPDLIAREAPPERRLALLRPRVTDADPAVRRETAKALEYVAEADRAEAFSLLLTLLGDPEPSVRRAVNVYNSDFKSIPWTPAHEQRMIGLARNADSEVRMAAASMIGWHSAPSEEGILALARLLEDPEPEVRRSAAYSLSELGGKAVAAAPALVRALRDRETYRSSISSTAHDALRKMTLQPPAVLPGLLAILKDGNVPERRRALDLIGRLGPAGAGAIPELVPLLESNDQAVRLDAAFALWRLGHREERLASILTGILADPAEPNVSEVLRLLQESSAGAGFARPALRGLLERPDAEESFYEEILDTLSALGTDSGDAPALARVVARLRCSGHIPCARSDAMQALGRIGPRAAREAVPALIGVMEDDTVHWTTRGEVVEALGRIGRPSAEALPALTRLLKREASQRARNGASYGNLRWRIGDAIAAITAPVRPAGETPKKDGPPIARLSFDQPPAAPGWDGIAFAEGVRGRAAVFDGSRTAEFRWEKPLELGKTFTLAAWIRADSLEMKSAGSEDYLFASDIFSLRVGPKGELFRLWRVAEHMSLSHDILQGKSANEAGRWHHVAVVHDGYAGEVLEFVDGSRTCRDDDYHLQNDEGDLIRIGERLESICFGGWKPEAPSFRGAVDELELYDYARSPEQIAAAARRP